MKLTKATNNLICKQYEKKFLSFIKTLAQAKTDVNKKNYSQLKSNFFLSNWICLYWFFLEHQYLDKPHKKISKKTFDNLKTKEFARIYADIFRKTIIFNKNHKNNFWTKDELEAVFNPDFKLMCAYLNKTPLVLTKDISDFFTQITPALITFSVYDFCLQPMKFIFEYDKNQEHIYEQNVWFLQKQIDVLTPVQKAIQNLKNFPARNDAIILVTTLRKKITK